MRDSIFITGGSGLLALSWAIALRDRHAVTLGLHERVVSLRDVATHPASLDTVDGVLRALDTITPGLVVHAAGLTNVERCEANPELAHHVNVELAANVARACAQRRVSLVHISTDHLFDGSRPLVDETEPVDPQNTYARTKAAAEIRVLEANPEALVVRTNFYGWGPRYRHSFSDFVVDSLRRGSPVTLFRDVAYTPIVAAALKDAVLELAALRISGIVNVVGDERLSKYEFGVRIAKTFELDLELIRPGLLADQPALVRRPRDMSLSNAKVRELLQRELGGVDAHLEELHRQERLGLAQEVQNL